MARPIASNRIISKIAEVVGVKTPVWRIIIDLDVAGVMKVYTSAPAWLEENGADTLAALLVDLRDLQEEDKEDVDG